MTEQAQRFPFGRRVKPVLPVASGRPRVFVLGVYPSALHAKWKDPEGRLWPALVVDNEPEPFWSGQAATERVEALARDVPERAGHLSPAGPDHNGAPGRILDELYLGRLGPQGVTREECWISDLVQTYLASQGQVRRIEETYQRYAMAGVVPPARLTPRRGRITRLTPERVESLRQELEEASPDLVVTLGWEPIQCLSLEPLRHEGYGRIRSATVLGLAAPHLGLVHPRQAGGLGRASREWKETHENWTEGAASALSF